MGNVSLTVNGVLHELELEPRELLVYVLRERLGLTALVAKRANGGVESAAIGLVNMGATQLRASAAEQALVAGADAGAVAAEGTDPPSDTQASAEYRRHLAGVLVRRAAGEALG